MSLRTLYSRDVLKQAVIAHHRDFDLVLGTYPSSSYDPASLELRNLSISTTPQTFTISPPLSPLTFNGKNYHDAQISLDGDWSSAYLPDGWYGTMAPGQAVWGAVADKRQLGGLPSRTRGFIDVAYGRSLTRRFGRYYALAETLVRPMRPPMWRWGYLYA